MLPVGSIVYLKEGKVKIIIMNRYPLIDQNQKKVYFDYSGSVYPEGLDPKRIIYFNQSNIDQVVFEGYKNEEEERYQTILADLIQKNQYAQGKVRE
ncbi:hypothetical protein MFLO_12166 [Listeria floridensis FSL S10-1187]|uniref:DUF4176 domain-containing protein n=1 Tax=Listeria floridensis FSL S10-1187 TaxID=1265817 RepID=A0ABN0RDB4_9LIST|nr:DUF4176 domain-containing protein [Listeria floridensis]EUJ28499.1 hypothetical protein MFLO_12166 [Listeria floridensis FSL S10-1187]